MTSARKKAEAQRMEAVLSFLILCWRRSFFGGHGAGFGFGFGLFDFKFGVVGIVVAAAIGGMVAIVGVALSAICKNLQLSASIRIFAEYPHPIRIRSASIRNV